MTLTRFSRKAFLGNGSLQKYIGCLSTLGLTILLLYAAMLSGFTVVPRVRERLSWFRLESKMYPAAKVLNQEYNTLVAENELLGPRAELRTEQGLHQRDRNRTQDLKNDYRIYESLILKANVTYGDNGCVRMGVTQRNDSREDIACVSHRASAEACKFANKLYYQNDSLKRCQSRTQVNVCDVYEKSLDGNTEFLYNCSLDGCLAQSRSHVAVRATRVEDRKVVLIKLFNTVEALQLEMPVISRQASLRGQSYLFLDCSNGSDDTSVQETIGQFLILPPYDLKEAEKTRRILADHGPLPPRMNVNLLFLDSVARPHFYRSLPTVVEVFKELNSDPDGKSVVFDFELFQAVEGHTAENAHALLTGTLFPKNFTGSDREATPVGYGKLFEKFTKMGYHITYQDDLCYDEFWGIRLELGSPKSYKEFDKRLTDNHIHNTGLTFASCRLLKLNGVTNPFNGPDHPLCYNNRFTAEYYLELAIHRQRFASSRKMPLFTYSVLNVAHDHTGRRVQSVDWVLSEFVRRSAALENTLTIILSDHGNTYAPYTHAIMEGRFEQYHPFLFLLIPNSVQMLLGAKVMENLRLNQRRLFTMLDIHLALSSIPAWSADGLTTNDLGLFGQLSSKRTCDDLTLRLPNLCICESWGTEVSNKTDQTGVLEFAVGELNNMISLRQSSLPRDAIRRCKRLIPLSFFDMTERNDDANLVSSFTFSVPAGNGAREPRDIFTVQVSSSIFPGRLSRGMKLLSYDRLSRFGPYEQCRDQVVDKRLCICDIVETSKDLPTVDNVLAKSMLEKPAMFPVVQEISNRSMCVHLVVRKYLDLKRKDSIWTASFEVANLCNVPVSVTISVELQNMKTTQKFPMKRRVPAYTILYIGGVIRSVPYRSSAITSYDFVQSADDTSMAVGFR